MDLETLFPWGDQIKKTLYIPGILFLHPLAPNLHVFLQNKAIPKSRLRGMSPGSRDDNLGMLIDKKVKLN